MTRGTSSPLSDEVTWWADVTESHKFVTKTSLKRPNRVKMRHYSLRRVGILVPRGDRGISEVRCDITSRTVKCCLPRSAVIQSVRRERAESDVGDPPTTPESTSTSDALARHSVRGFLWTTLAWGSNRLVILGLTNYFGQANGRKLNQREELAYL